MSFNRKDNNIGPFKIVIIYLIFGLFWILFSDSILYYLVSDTELIKRLQTFKGWFYVIITSILLYALIKSYVFKLESTKTEMERLNEQINMAISATDTILYVLKIENGKFIPEWISENIKNVWEYDMQEVLGRDWWSENIFPEDKAETLERHKEILEKGEILHEYRFVKKNGSVDWVYDRAKVIYDKKGNPSRITGIWIDITKRKKAEAELKESERKYRELVENANSIILRWTPEGIITFINEFGLKFFEYKEEELLGHHVVGVIVPETETTGRDLEMLIEEITKDPKSFEYNINENMKKSGERVWISWTNKTIFDEKGNIKEILSIGSDITEEKKAVEAVKRSEQIMKIFIENAPASIAMFDRDMKYIAVSKRYIKDFRLGELNPIGLSYYEVFPEIPDRWKEIHKKCLQGFTEKNDEDMFIRKDGTVEWIRWEIHPWYESLDKIGGLIIFSEVITEKKKTQIELQKYREHLEELVKERTEELEKANEKLKELDRLKSMFIASMSHELRTPLNSIIGFSSILLDEWIGPLNDEQKLNLQTINRAGKHLLSLINDVIDVSKIEAGVIDVLIEDFDVNEIIMDAIKTVENDLIAKGLKLNYEQFSFPMHTDRRRLKQVLLNLLSNAIKYTEKGEVSIKAGLSETKPDLIEIVVEDTGIGIKKEDMPKLFQPFQRISSTVVKKIPGTGLGLYLTKKLVTEILKGDIYVESTYGKGSRFIVQIPSNMLNLS